MKTRTFDLRNGENLLIREAEEGDARLLLQYVQTISGESDYLSFGPGEFEITEEEEERAILRRFRDSDNQIFLVGLVDDMVVSALAFSADRRPRTRHTGELGMAVRKPHWGKGIGSLMLDTLIAWARDTGIVKKVNLRVRTDNLRAIRLYERKGFVNEGTIRREIFLDGRYYDHHWMGLEL